MTNHPPVRLAITCCVLAALCIFVPSAGAAEASAALEGAKRIEVQGDFGGWVTALPDGRLMTWWTEDKPGSKSAKGSVQQAWARYSTDKGATWSGPQLLLEFPRSTGKSRYTRDARGGVLCDKDGGLHLIGLHWSDWSWEKFAGRSAVFHVKSNDGGKRWSNVQILRSPYRYSGMHMPLCLRSGRIIVPIWHAFDDRRAWGCICAISDDRGETWRTTGQMGAGLEDEQSGVELKDGRVWMLFRANHGHLLEAFSKDGGETWVDIRPSRFVAPASPPALLRLKDGRIIVIWNNSLKPKHVFNRLVLAAAISSDDGKTWRGYREIARTSGVPGPKGWVCYPYITQTKDGTVIVTYGTAGFKANLLRLDPDWLMQTIFREGFSRGLANWNTMRTKGVSLVAHPTRGNGKVLALRKPDANTAAGASLNFPFGAEGALRIRLRLEPGFQGVRICLTDHFTWPFYAEDGRFGIRVWANGQIVEPVGAGEIAQTGSTLKAGKWHTLRFAWDCKRRTCALSVDAQHVADLSQRSRAAGICYLRLWSSALQTDQAGLLVDSVGVSVKP